MEDNKQIVIVCIDCGNRMVSNDENTDPWQCTECGSLFVERDDHWLCQSKDGFNNDLTNKKQ
jgi:DNA-directed RNA polymerase subunit RPC12/RpoP